MYKLKKVVVSDNFSAQFIKIISHHKMIGYNIKVLQQTACLVVNPITVGNFAFLFNCKLPDRTWFRLKGLSVDEGITLGLMLCLRSVNQGR